MSTRSERARCPEARSPDQSGFDHTWLIDGTSRMSSALFSLGTPPPLFSQVFILKELQVICFDTLLQVLILKVFTLQQELCGCDRLKAIQGWRFRA